MVRPISAEQFEQARRARRGAKPSPATKAVLDLSVGQALALEHLCDDQGSCGFATNLYRMSKRHGRRIEAAHQEGELFVIRRK